MATSLQVTPLTPTPGLGDTLPFQATATFTDGTTQDRTALVTWATSAPTIAPITAAGLATGQSEGQATITASDPTGLTASTTVTVILPSPVITALVPATGTIGTAGTITGKYLQTLQVVAFNGLPAVVLQQSATSILTTVPIGATTGPVTVTTSRGTASMVFTVTLTGDFTLTALPTPPAVYTLTVSGTAQVDGKTITRTAQVALEVLPTGTTAVTGRILTAESIPQPIPGVTVVLGGATTFTDAAGNFVLQQAPPGPNLLFVDGRTASTPAAQFPIVETQITVNATGPTRVPFIIYLPKLDTANAVNLPTDASGTVTQDFTVTTPAIPGLEIKIPAGRGSSAPTATR